MADVVTVGPDGPTPTAPRGEERRRTFRRRRRVAATCAAVVLVVFGVAAWFLLEAYPLGDPGKIVAFQVRQGESISQVADEMSAKGIIGSALAFRLDLLVAGTPSVRPGWYELATSSSFPTVHGVLSAGPNAVVLPVLTAETTHEVAQHLASLAGAGAGSRFLSAAQGSATPASSPYGLGATSFEGLVAPGDYVLGTGGGTAALLSEMSSRFTRRATAAGLLPSTTAHGLDAYRLLTVASIVEKEGYLAKNMPQVATVIYNRLARGMPLQMDATVEYAINQDGGPVTHATEQIQSPYNTYLHTGLTPTPICIPSTEAIDAALHPAIGPWLYFTLVDRSGTLAFSSTFAEQLQNEQLAHQRGL